MHQEAEYIQDFICETPISVTILLSVSLFLLFAHIKTAGISVSSTIVLLTE